MHDILVFSLQPISNYQICFTNVFINQISMIKQALLLTIIF